MGGENVDVVSSIGFGKKARMTSLNYTPIVTSNDRILAVWVK